MRLLEFKKAKDIRLMKKLFDKVWTFAEVFPSNVKVQEVTV